MTTFREKINADYYTSKLPYPARVTEPKILRQRVGELTDEELGGLSEVKTAYQNAKDAYEVALAAYRQDSARLGQEFRADLEAEHGTTGHPKAALLMSKAESRGHSGGLGEVASAYEDYVELVDLV